MPDSSDSILTRLRESVPTKGLEDPWIRLADAEAAVLAAADTRTREIVAMIRDEASGYEPWLEAAEMVEKAVIGFHERVDAIDSWVELRDPRDAGRLAAAVLDVVRPLILREAAEIVQDAAKCRQRALLARKARVTSE